VDADPARALAGGSGLARLWDLLEAQGAGRLRPPAVHPVRRTLTTDRAGWVSSIDALAVGMAVVDAGGGRRRKEDPVDHGAGVTIEAPVGTRVQGGEALAHVHAASEELADRALLRLGSAWLVGPAEVRRPPHIRARADRNGCRLLV
jgi:thymidine phosphorylase